MSKREKEEKIDYSLPVEDPCFDFPIKGESVPIKSIISISWDIEGGSRHVDLREEDGKLVLAGDVEYVDDAAKEFFKALWDEYFSRRDKEQKIKADKIGESFCGLRYDKIG